MIYNIYPYNINKEFESLYPYQYIRSSNDISYMLKIYKNFIYNNDEFNIIKLTRFEIFIYFINKGMQYDQIYIKKNKIIYITMIVSLFILNIDLFYDNFNDLIFLFNDVNIINIYINTLISHSRNYFKQLSNNINLLYFNNLLNLDYNIVFIYNKKQCKISNHSLCDFVKIIKKFNKYNHNKKEYYDLICTMKKYLYFSLNRYYWIKWVMLTQIYKK